MGEEGFPRIFFREVKGKKVPMVDLRDLWRFLEIEEDFETWAKDKIKELGAVEGQDYLVSEIGRQVH